MRLQSLVVVAFLSMPWAAVLSQTSPVTIAARFSVFDMTRVEAGRFAEAINVGLATDSLLKPVARASSGARYSLDARLGWSQGKYVFNLAVVDNGSSQVIARDSAIVGTGETLAAVATQHAQALAREVAHHQVRTPDGLPMRSGEPTVARS